MDNHYSLWLMPEGKDKEKLQIMIRELSDKYTTPVFPPHITLIGGINLDKEDVVEKTRQLSERLCPYRIELTKPGYLNQYFRCVFSLVNKTREVMHANKVAQEVFDIEEDYIPHLSLLYGDFPEKTKKKIISGIEEIRLSFIANTIYIYKTGKEVNKWHTVSEFSLQGNYKKIR